jgi:hypothetical protein
MKKQKRLLIVATILFLVSMACQALFPKTITPGSLEEQIAEGEIRFTGSGNVTYIGCQDPTAEVTLYIGPKTKELNGITYETFVNPVTIDVTTYGTMVKIEECQKSSVEDRFGWSAQGLYYARDEKIVLYSCAANNYHKAEGEVYLVGEGFEGEYVCHDRDNGGLMYEVAISAYEITK